MPTVHHPPDNGTDPLPDRDAIPYWRPLPPPDWAAIDAVLAELGLLPSA